MNTETETSQSHETNASKYQPQVKLVVHNEAEAQNINLNESQEKCGDVPMVKTLNGSIAKTTTSKTPMEYHDQGDVKITIDKKCSTVTSADTHKIQFSYSTSAILVPVITATSGRNILEEMKRRVASTFTSRQSSTKSSLVPGTNVEYKTPGANNKNKNGKIKRPMNAFMVWAREYRSYLATSMPHATNSEISVKLGQIWAAMKADDKRTYYDIAEKIKTKHRKDYPGWVYQPSTPGLKKKEETLNYGRTPTPPNSPQVGLIPVSSTIGSGTQQTTIVVLSNDNKIHHTTLTSSPTSTTAGISTFLETLPVSRKVVPCDTAPYNQKIVQPKTLGDKTTAPILSTNTIIAEKNCNNGCNSSLKSLMKIGDPALVQYQSAMEIPCANNVSSNTKDLLAMKLSSSKPYISSSNNEKQKKTPINGVSVQNSSNSNTALERQQNISEKTNPNSFVQNVVLNAPPTTRSISQQIVDASNTTSSTHRNTQATVLNGNNGIKVQTISGVDLKQNTTALTPATKRGIEDKSVANVSTNTMAAKGLQYVFNPTNSKNNEHSSKINPSNRVLNGSQLMAQNPRILSLQQLRQPLIHANIRPTLSRNMVNIAPNNRMRWELQNNRPGGTNIPSSMIPTAENFKIKAERPIPQQVTSGESNILNKVTVNTESSARSEPETDDKLKSASVHQYARTVENTSSIQYSRMGDRSNNIVDLSRIQQRLHEISQSVPSSSMDDHEQDYQLKQTDELWPFPFSDNPGDWDDEDNDKYVEMIDPSDPFLTPDEFMSEMFPGALHLDIERWRQYMSAEPNEESENLDTYFHESSDDITISPVPLKETLKRLVNIRKQESKMCDVISGDLFIDRDEENAVTEQSVDTVLDDAPNLLTNEMAKSLTNVMGSLMAKHKDDIIEDNSENYQLNQATLKAHLNDQTGEVTYNFQHGSDTDNGEANETVNEQLDNSTDISKVKLENVDDNTNVQKSDNEVEDSKPLILSVDEAQSIKNEPLDYTETTRHDELITEKTDTEKCGTTLSETETEYVQEGDTPVQASEQVEKHSSDTPRPRRSTRCRSKTKARS